MVRCRPTFSGRSQVSPSSILRRDEERSLLRLVTVPREGELLLDADGSIPKLATPFSTPSTRQRPSEWTRASTSRISLVSPPRNMVDGDPSTVWIGSWPPDT